MLVKDELLDKVVECVREQMPEDRAAHVEEFVRQYYAWIPQGPDDPSVVLIKLSANTAQYWDTPGGRIASLISFVKSKVTGERYEGGEEGVVEFHTPGGNS